MHNDFIFEFLFINDHSIKAIKVSFFLLLLKDTFGFSCTIYSINKLTVKFVEQKSMFRTINCEMVEQI